MIAVVTVNIGDYDTLKPLKKQAGFDYYMVTDGHAWEGWEKIEAKKDSRFYKWCSHVYLKGYKKVIYIDASYRIKDLNVLLNQFKGGFLALKHPQRECVYQEAYRCHQLGKGNIERVGMYLAEGMPENGGLTENGIFIREHSEEVNKMCEAVYRETLVVKRDQLALPYILWKTGFKISVLSNVYAAMIGALHPHKKKVFVHHITPASGDKNYGGAINAQIEPLPDDDWICLRDGDTMFLHPSWPSQIEQLSQQNFNLIGCMTNRLGLPWQLHEGKISEDPNVLNHYEISERLFNTHGATVEPLNNTIAGLFMLFPRRIWDEVKFKEGLHVDNAFIDYHFSIEIYRRFGKIGLAKGLYLFHFYRFNKNRRDISHLL